MFRSTSWLYQKYPWTLNNHRRKKYFTDKNKKIGFATLDKELPEWIDEAMDKLLEK